MANVLFDLDQGQDHLDQGLQDIGQDLDHFLLDTVQDPQDQDHFLEVLQDSAPGQGLHHQDGDLVHAAQADTTGGLHHPMVAGGQGHHLQCTEAGQGHHLHMTITDQNGKVHHPCMVIIEDQKAGQLEEDPHHPRIPTHMIHTTGKAGVYRRILYSVVYFL